MRPDHLYEAAFPRIDAITKQSDLVRKSSDELKARREQVHEVKDRASAAVDQITARCGGRPALEEMPPGVRSTGAVILDRSQTPEGVPFLIVGRIDVHHPPQNDLTLDLQTVEAASVHMGVAPAVMPFGAGRSSHSKGRVTALDGSRYYVEWLRTETTDEGILAVYASPLYTDADPDTQVRADATIDSLHESIELITNAAIDPALNGGV